MTGAFTVTLDRLLQTGKPTGRLAVLLVAGTLCFYATGAHAISDLPSASPPAAEEAVDDLLPPLEGPQVGPDGGLPDPSPVIRNNSVPPDNTLNADDDGATGTRDYAQPDAIFTDPAMAPEAVQRMRELILEAAATGELENLRPLLGTGPTATRLALNGIDTDPVDYLRSVSGDAEGQEVMAILIDILNAGFARIDEGQPGETWIWPWFAAAPLENLTAPQRVELLRIVTAGDVEDMRAYGAYNFYRAGFAPDGSWRFFLAGD